jgi:hypothetical protein
MVAWILIEIVSNNTDVFISFNDGGSRGRLEVTEKDGCLVVFYDHVYKGEEHNFDEKYSCVLSPTHATVKACRDLSDGRDVYPEDTEELCNLLGLLGLRSLRAEKDRCEDDLCIVVDGFEAEELKSQVEKVVVNYFDRLTDGSEDIEFSLYYQLQESTYYLDLEVSWQESDSENETGTLTVEFILEDAGKYTTVGYKP